MLKDLYRLSVGLLLVALVLFPVTTQAAFDQNQVVDDDAFTNSASMTVAQIQNFFDTRKSVLAGFSEGGRSAAQIIFDAAKANNVNPQILIATLQREQSLVTTTASYNTATDSDGKLRKSMGYACPDSGGCDAKYAGFTKQVDGTAYQYRYNFDGSKTNKFTDYQLNQTMTFDGIAVTLRNQATASIYRYTPHVAGAKSLYNFFFSYFLEYSSDFASQNSYPFLAPGDSYKFQVSFANIGNRSWNRGTVYLGTDRDRDRISVFNLDNRINKEDTMWTTANRVSLKEQTVPIGGVGTFEFYMSAATNMAPGTYREYFRPLAEGIQWMDDDRVYWDVTVENHKAEWAGQSMSSEKLEPGQSVQLEVRLRNAGRTTWRRDIASPVRLATSRERDRVPLFIREDKAGGNPSGWVNPNRIQMVEGVVAPGETGTFRFWYTVPETLAAGTYREYFQPVHETVGWMQDLGIYFDLVVGPQKASFVSQSAYPTLAKGESAMLSVKFRNDGTTSWKKGGSTPMRLSTVRPNDRTIGFIRDDVPGRNPSGWVTPNRIELVESEVKPGENGTFNFWITVPGDKSPGTYREHFGLVQENYRFLPDIGLYWDITVK